MDIVSTAFENNREKIKSPMGMFVVGMVIVLIVAVYYFFIKKKNPDYIELINDQVLANTEHPAFSGKLCPLAHNGVEFGYSFWIYVDAWEHSNYGDFKPVMTRGDPDSGSDDFLSGPSIWINPSTSELIVVLDLIVDDITSTPLSNITDFLAKNTECSNGLYKCALPDIHLQKWIHFAVSLEDKTLDIYMNGKLLKSCVMEDRPRLVESDTRIGKLANMDSFIGYISRFSYFSRLLNSREVYKLYQKGPTPMDNIFSRLYKSIKLGFEPNSESSKYTGLALNQKDEC